MDATVQGLDRVDVLLPVVRELGLRHPRFGDSDEHHATIAVALFWTLEKCLRDDFTPQVRSAWIKTYGVLSQTMRADRLRLRGVTLAAEAPSDDAGGLISLRP